MLSVVILVGSLSAQPRQYLLRILPPSLRHPDKTTLSVCLSRTLIQRLQWLAAGQAEEAVWIWVPGLICRTLLQVGYQPLGSFALSP
jgi:hypothetical protein